MKIFKWLMAAVCVLGSFTAPAQVGHEMLTNNSGGALTQGAVVIVDSANATSFTTTTSVGNKSVVGIVFDSSIADESAGLLMSVGSYTTSIQVTGTVAIGDFLRTSATAGRGESAAADGESAFAIATTANASGLGTVEGVLLLPRGQLSPSTAETITGVWNFSNGAQFGGVTIPSGTGTSGNVTRWTGTNTIGDSLLLDDGTDLEIPNATDLVFRNAAAADDGTQLERRAGNAVFFSHSANSIFFEDLDGGLGVRIGTTATASQIVLDSDGAATFNEAGNDVDFRVESDTITNALFVEGGDGDVSMGITAGDGHLHVHSATAGVVAASADADEIVAENSTNAGISILAADTTNAAVFLGEGTTNEIAALEWLGSTNVLELNTIVAGADLAISTGNNVLGLTVDSNQDVTMTNGIFTNSLTGNTEKVRLGSSNLTANSNADDFVLEVGAGLFGGISILNNGTNQASLNFGDAASTIAGRVRYNHGTDTLDLNAGAAAVMTFTSGRSIVENQLAFTQSTLTAATGVITVVDTYHLVAGEGAAADIVTTVNGGTIGDIVIFQASVDTIDITFDELGNLVLGAATRLLDSVDDSIILIYNGTAWNELSFVDNN